MNRFLGWLVVLSAFASGVLMGAWLGPGDSVSVWEPLPAQRQEAAGMVVQYLHGIRVSEFETCGTWHEGVSTGDYTAVAYPDGGGFLVGHTTRQGDFLWRVWPESGTVAVHQRPAIEGIC